MFMFTAVKDERAHFFVEALLFQSLVIIIFN